MTDLSATIAPKSDQLNADDLIPGPRTIRVTRVAQAGTAEQPIDIFFEGDNGKPYKPCKSMRRVLVHVWGRDGASYVGRSMTLYRDPEVMFGGMKVGGIRISHMSHIDSDVTMALTATRASRKPYTVRPLQNAPQAAEDAPWRLEDAERSLRAADSLAALETAWKQRRMGPFRDQLQSLLAERKAELTPEPAEEDGYDGV